jgi:hypothetical protein
MANEPSLVRVKGQIAEKQRGPFAQYWPFPATPRQRDVNQKGKEFEVGLFGSANIARFEVALRRGHFVGTHQAQVAVRFAFINAEKARCCGFVRPK